MSEKKESACFQEFPRILESRRFSAAFTLSPDKRCVVLRIDFPDFLYAIDIGLVDALNAAPAAVVTAGAELAVDAARAPQRLVDDLLPLFPCSVLDQYGFHFFILS